MSSVDFEVRIENIYPDVDEDDEETPDAMSVTFDDETKELVKNVEHTAEGITVTLEMSVDSDYLPSEFADDDEWEQWGQDNIFPHTGIGRTEGDAGYFAEITSAKSTGDDDEVAYIVGKSWEWGT